MAKAISPNKMIMPASWAFSMKESENFRPVMASMVKKIT